MSRDRLIIFARYPTPGRAKTRLIGALGTHGASLLQHRMTLQTLETVRQFLSRSDTHVELRASGELAAMRELYPGPWDLGGQGGGDLGERLHRAFVETFSSGAKRVVVIGSDCPALTAEHLRTAFATLASHDLVLGPATDGGYYLIGLRRASATLFDAIDWSTSRVLEQTRAAALRIGYSIAKLDALADVDVPQDLSAMRPVFHSRRIAVTGATGILGTRFLHRAMGENPALHATALVRSASASFQRPAFQDLLALHGHRMTLVEADLRSLSLSSHDRRAIANTDGGLWHFAANTTLRPGSGSFADDVWAVNDGGTRTLLDVVLSSAHPGPFFHVSTAYVCGTDVGTVYEDRAAPPSGFRNSYEASKYSAEARVQSAFENGLRGAIFRPSVIVGDELTGGVCKAVDLLGDALMKSIDRQDGPLVLRLPHDAAINVVHVDWVVESLIALARPDANAATYHLTSRAPLKLVELAQIVCPDSPDSALVMDPRADLQSLSPLSRALDRALASLRPYLTAKVNFDRKNFNTAAPSLGKVPEFDARAVFEHRAKLLTRDFEVVG